jgi:hypothetical protein
VKFQTIFVLSLLLSTGLGEAKGWVTTKGSMGCIRTRGLSVDHLVDCIRTPLLEEEIEKKLQPNNPHGKHDLAWWHQQKKEINQQCIKEAKKDYINLLKFTESAPNKMAIGPKTRTKYMKLMCEMTAMI